MPSLALISPKGAEYAMNGILSNFFKTEPKMKNIRKMWNSPNLGLLTVAALTPADWDITYIDEHQKEIDFAQRYYIVAISCMTQQINRGLEIAELFYDQGAVVVLGGIHTTVYPRDNYPKVDAIMVGEAELLWSRFLEDWKKKKIKKIYQEEYPGSYDIKNSPIPRYDLIQDYQYETITVATSRGCSHACSFCAASRVFGSVYRRKSNEQVIKELKEIKRLLPKRYILFGDDNIFESREESKELLLEIEKLNISWVAQTDISIGSDIDLLKRMERSGCHWVVVGLESISSKNLERVGRWKAERVKYYKEYISNIQANRIGVLGAFVFGLDYDDYHAMEETIKFIKDCNLYGIHVTSPTPFPGTRYRDEIKAEGRLIEKSWSYYTHWDVLIKPKLLTEDEVQDCIYQIYQSFISDEESQNRFRNFIHVHRLISNRGK